MDVVIQLHNSDARKIDLLHKEKVEEWNAWRRESGNARVTLREENFWKKNLAGVNLSNCDLVGTSFAEATLDDSNCEDADLTWTELVNTSMSGANLHRANLRFARLVNTNLSYAELSEAHVFGAAVWNVDLVGATQRNLVITSEGDENEITSDDLEVAQFIYLLLQNSKIRSVIDTITMRLVLILGRFSAERIEALRTIRTVLRSRNYVPVLFDFPKPDSQTLMEAVSTLAHLARFVIADVGEPRIVLQEVPHIVQNIFVPVQPICAAGILGEPDTWADLRRQYKTLLPTFVYEDINVLIHSLQKKVIEPAEAASQRFRAQRSL